MDLTGKTVLITGASSGIGLEASVKLARMGAEVVLVARDKAKADAAVADVKQRSGKDQVSGLACDFSSQKAIRALARDYRAGHSRLDILINNAGLVSDVRKETEDGIELTWAVNHLGYYLLTSLLLDLVEASAPARIVNVASTGHYRGDIDFEDVGFAKGGYFVMSAYTRSKLGNVLFSNELARKLSGKGVTVNSLHPGAVATNIWSKAPWYAKPFIAVFKAITMISAEQGGDTIVYLATSSEVEGQTGGYYEKNRKVKPASLALDEAVAKRLWDFSDKQVAASAT